jgi:hypothetical protein
MVKVKTKETKYMLLSNHQNEGQNHDIKIANRCFENVAQFRYLGRTVANQNSAQGEIKRNLAILATVQSRGFCLVCCLKRKN